MAEQNQEFDLPCEFCGDLFPESQLILHSTGCELQMFASIEVPETAPQLKKSEEKLLTSSVPEVKPGTFRHGTNSLKQNEKIFPKSNEGSLTKIEHMITNEVYEIKVKSDGEGSLLKVSGDHVENEKKVKTAKPSFSLCYGTSLQEQAEINVSSFKSGDTQGLFIDNEDPEFSDDYNEDKETIEGVLFRGSLELARIKQSINGARPKSQALKFSCYNQNELLLQQ